MGDGVSGLWAAGINSVRLEVLLASGEAIVEGLRVPGRGMEEGGWQMGAVGQMQGMEGGTEAEA